MPASEPTSPTAPVSTTETLEALSVKVGQRIASIGVIGILGIAFLTIIDATAGLGRDSFLLAAMGASVTLIERSPQVHALLAEALATARAESPDLAAITARMTLLHGDARDLLPTLQADVVTVDPMHPERTKTALVKQEMRLLREIVGTDPDVTELMQAALAARSGRVVLKWPLRAEPLQGVRKPSHQIEGKTVRYDVFVQARGVDGEGSS